MARTAEMLEAMSVLVASELVVAVRALRVAGRTQAGAGVRALFDAAALVLPAGTKDRAFGRAVEAVQTVVQNFVGVKVRG
jgi:histidine ammonia-lyase